MASEKDALDYVAISIACNQASEMGDSSLKVLLKAGEVT